MPLAGRTLYGTSMPLSLPGKPRVTENGHVLDHLQSGLGSEKDISVIRRNSMGDSGQVLTNLAWAWQDRLRDMYERGTVPGRGS